MYHDDAKNDLPQFTTAEYIGTPGPSVCSQCQQAVGHHYFRILGRMICAGCALQARRQMPQDSHAAYMRALLFGIGAAVAGLILYAAVGIITGLMIGYVSLAVGYIVGKAMMMGSKGLGGRRYQITAVLLTYAAVSMAAVPVGISQIAKQRKIHQQQIQQEQQQLEKEFGQQPGNTRPPVLQKISFGTVLARLALLGLTSPFLALMDPLHGLIGLVILLVGVRIAWQLTAGKTVEVLGPFENTVPVT